MPPVKQRDMVEERRLNTIALKEEVKIADFIAALRKKADPKQDEALARTLSKVNEGKIHPSTCTDMASAILRARRTRRLKLSYRVDSPAFQAWSVALYLLDMLAALAACRA